MALVLIVLVKTQPEMIKTYSITDKKQQSKNGIYQFKKCINVAPLTQVCHLAMNTVGYD